MGILGYVSNKLVLITGVFLKWSDRGGCRNAVHHVTQTLVMINFTEKKNSYREGAMAVIFWWSSRQADFAPSESDSVYPQKFSAVQ